jgi:hypothetical protein
VGEVFRLVLEFKAQEIAWLLNALLLVADVALLLAQWVIIPGAVFWAIVLFPALFWRWRRLRWLVVIIVPFAVWLEWNLLAAALVVSAAVPLPLLASGVMLLVGAALCLMVLWALMILRVPPISWVVDRLLGY